MPYFDARNGPPNFLLHNEGNATFSDRTAAAGLNVDNDRYSFACAWGDLNSDGTPDLYVANDFGRSNLYRNNGDGTFAAVSTEAGVEDAGAGMSACWFDFDNDGNQDIYVANMWSAAGQRVSEQEIFHQRGSRKHPRPLPRTRPWKFSLSQSGQRQVSKRKRPGGSRDGPLGLVFRCLGFRSRWLP